MKKKWLAMLLCGCLAFTGCGSDGEDGEVSNNGGEQRESGGLFSGNRGNDTPTPTTAADPDDGTKDGDGGDAVSEGAYWAPQGSVELGQYLGITVDKVEAVVADEDVQYELDSLLEQHAETVEITDRNVVEDGDYVGVDFTLMVGGEEVDAAQDEYLTAGGGNYDFDMQLAGLYLNESKTFECEIQDIMYNDYIGQTGTYIVQIKSINKQVLPEMTDAFIAENTDFSTVAEYRQDIYDTLLKEAEEDAQDDQVNALFQKIMDNSKFTGISDADIQSYVDEVVAYYEQYASMFGMDLNSIISVFMGATYDEFIALAKEDGEYTVKQNLILEAVVKDAGITLTDEEYTAALAEYAAANDFESPQAVEDYYYKEDLVQHFRLDKAYDMIVDAMIVQ